MRSEMIKDYMEPDSKDAFVDYPRQSKKLATELGLTAECPQCKGHGGWNLQLNAYPLHGKPSTKKNRHLFSHFRAGCTNCQGYGYVAPKDAHHIHKWNYVRNIGNCLNLYECECGLKWQVDSSD